MKSRLLVVHTGGAGDFICTFPTLAALARTFDIEIAGIPERAMLAIETGLAVAVHDIEATGFHTVFSEPDARLRAFAAPFDEALIWMADSDGTLARNLGVAGISNVRCFPGIPPDEWTLHAAHWYGSRAGVEISQPFQAAFSPMADAPEVVLQPGSGSRKKNWPLAYFEDVARHLTQRGHQVVWCTGPAEAALAQRPETLSPMPLTELARLLAGARLFIGNDSGISHLAAAAGCPTLAIFGPTDPRVWGPAGPRVRVLQGQPWPDVTAVVEAALELLARA